MTGTAAPSTTPTGSELPFPQTIGDPAADAAAAEAAAAATAPAAAPTPEQQQLAALQVELAQERADRQRMMDLLITRPQQAPQQQQVPQMPEFSLEGLPDPVTAPKDFQTGLQARMRTHTQNITQSLTHNITQQVARGAALDGLFNRFRTQHGELAKKEGILQGVALAEFRAMQARGLDPVSIAMQNPDSIITAIAERMNRELGVQPTAPGTAPAVVPTTIGSAARTTGIAGGSTGAKGPAPTVQPKGFLTQLNEQRRKDGLI